MSQALPFPLVHRFSTLVANATKPSWGSVRRPCALPRATLEPQGPLRRFGPPEVIQKTAVKLISGRELGISICGGAN